MAPVTRSSLQALAVKWRVIGLFIVAFARLMRRYEDVRAPGAAPQTAQLEICVRAAHIMILQDIEEAAGAASLETGADDHALEFLRTVSVCLLAIGFVLQNILARGVLEASVWMQARNVFCARRPEFLPTPQGPAVECLDPG